MAARILIIHPKDASSGLEKAFAGAGDFLVRSENSAERGIECAFSWLPHAVLAAADLPGLSGLEFCRILKGDARTAHIPLIALFAPGASETEVIEMLRGGADETILTPCSHNQTLWRVRAVLRRFERSKPPKEMLRQGPLLLVTEERAAYFKGRELPLRKREFDLLAAFLRAPGKVLTRGALLESVWGYEAAVNPRIVDLTLARVRKKLGAGARLLACVHGIGYKLLAQRSGKLAPA